MIILFLMFCLLGISFYGSYVEPVLKDYYDNNTCEVENKSRSNLVSESGTYAFTIDELCSVDFLTRAFEGTTFFTYDIEDGSFSQFSWLSDTKACLWIDCNYSNQYGYTSASAEDITSIVYYYLSTSSYNYTRSQSWYLVINTNTKEFRCLFNCLYNDFTSNNSMFAVNINYCVYDDTDIHILSTQNESLINYLYYDEYEGAFNNGYNYGYYEGKAIGEGIGYQNGQADAYADIDNQDDVANSIFNGIFTVGMLPVNVFLGFMDWKVFGINISGLATGLLSIALIVIVFKFIMGHKV